MPIAGLVDLIASANGKFIEPVKRNNARLRITTGNLVKVLQSQFPDDTGYLTAIGKALAGDVYPLDVSFTPPSISTETRKTIGINNIPVNYGGYTTFGPCSCVFNNFIAADTFKFFYRWGLLPGGIRLNSTGTALDPVAPSAALPLPDLSGALNNGYKVNGIISQYYTYNTAAGDETEYGTWILQGMWPSSVTTTGFDLGNDYGSMVLTNVEFTVDLALPVASVLPGNATTQSVPVAQASRT
jgi:hypothetical protein